MKKGSDEKAERRAAMLKALSLVKDPSKKSDDEVDGDDESDGGPVLVITISSPKKAKK